MFFSLYDPLELILFIELSQQLLTQLFEKKSNETFKTKNPRLYLAAEWG